MATMAPASAIRAAILRFIRRNILILNGKMTNTMGGEDLFELSPETVRTDTQWQIFVAHDMQCRINIASGGSKEQKTDVLPFLSSRTLLPPNMHTMHSTDLWHGLHDCFN